MAEDRRAELDQEVYGIKHAIEEATYRHKEEIRKKSQHYGLEAGMNSDYSCNSMNAKLDMGEYSHNIKEDVCNWLESPYNKDSLLNQINESAHQTTFLSEKKKELLNGKGSKEKSVRSLKRQLDCSLQDNSYSGSSNEDTMSQSDEKPFVCYVCEKGYKQKGHLNVHMRIHYDEKPFLCNVCEKAFTTKFYLDNHLQTHSNNRPFICEICKKSFKQRAVLYNHMSIHSDERPFPCNLCDKAFKTKKKMNTHVLIHSEDRQFICDVCEKSFKTKHHLSDHMMTHSEKKPFSCDLCEKCFKLKRHLNVHTQVHTKKSMSPCNICKKSFPKWELEQHMRVHYGE